MSAASQLVENRKIAIFFVDGADFEAYILGVRKVLCMALVD